MFLPTACSPDASSSGPEKDAPSISISPSPAHLLSPSPLHQGSPSPGQPLILLLGSTLSVARGLPPEQGYAALLQQRLAAKQAPLSILNAGVAGETAAGASERLRYLLGYPLEQVILELGQADEARRTPPKAFARDVRKLLRHIRTQQPDVPVLILASARASDYSDALAAAADANGATLSTLLTETGAPLRSDDATLHQRLAEALWPVIGEGL
ncbi:MAG: hypothetical protein J5I94_18010 [Phaeodactylibacter sp.]|nr:hypothetical protein [Phaeodactylibacter sp.]